MDNARVHTAPDKREKAKLPSIKEQMLKKNIEVKFITTYAPMLNPVELVFNFLRQQTEKQRPRSYEEIKKAIEEVVELLNKQDLSNYFWHCARYFDKKEAKNSLLDTDKKSEVVSMNFLKKVTSNRKTKNERKQKDLLPRKRKKIK